MIKIRVPATSANLGAGFDSMGIALQLYNEVYISESDQVRITSADGRKIPVDERNMVYTAASLLYKTCGKKLKGLEIKQVSNIPMTRGLGSSSACLIAGMTGANKLLREPLSINDIIDLATSVEGHPDNIVPAAVGGFIIAVMDGSHVYFKRQEIGANLGFCVMIPQFTLSTKKAREILPSLHTTKDVVYNISRAAMLAASLPQGDLESLSAAMGDCLHEPHRMKLIKNGEAVYKTAKETGGAFVYLSGAGPTFISVYDRSDRQYVNRLKTAFKYKGINDWEIKDIPFDLDGTVITEGGNLWV